MSSWVGSIPPTPEASPRQPEPTRLRMPEPALITRARAGDREAAGALLRSMQDMIYRYCLSVLRDADAAGDATQETAVRFLRSIQRFSDRSKLSTWTLGIALNVCREQARAMQRGGRAEADAAVQASPEPDPGDRATHSEQLGRLQARLAALPMRQREAIVLRYLEQMTIVEVAATMGCAQGTVKATLWKGLRRLRNLMNKPA